MKRLFLIFFSILIIFNSYVFCDGQTNAVLENELLQDELQLARASQIYFVFDFSENKIYLKARGIVLREWSINKCNLWGNSFALKMLKLSGKSTLLATERKVIKPGEDTDTVEALKLDDMPPVYTLFMEEGVYISVRSRPEGIKLNLYNFAYTLKGYIFHPLQTVWYSFWGKPFAAIDIAFKDKKDAQALYWSFFESTSAILYNP